MGNYGRKIDALLLDTYEACLERSVSMLSASPPGSMRQVTASAAAAVCCLRLGHPAKAIKFASKALFLKPQDEEHRQLVKECTKELEHQGRNEAIGTQLQRIANTTGNMFQGGSIETVASLLKQLQNEGSSGGWREAAIQNILQELADELDQGGVDAQIAFKQLDGYTAVLTHIRTLHSDVIDVIMAAGVCHMYRKPQQVSTGKAIGFQALARARANVNANAQGRIRVRWPVSVLEDLLSIALDGDQIVGHHEDTRNLEPEGALQLLAVAALDPHQRQVGFMDAAAASTMKLSEGGSISSDLSGRSVDCSRNLSDALQEATIDDGISPLPASESISDVMIALLEGLEDISDSMPHSTETYNIESLQEECLLKPNSMSPDESAVTMSHQSIREQACQNAVKQEAAARGLDSTTCSSSASDITVPYEGTTVTGKPQLLPRLLDALWTPWLDALPPSSVLDMAQVISSYALGTKFDRQLLTKAARGKPLQLLLHLYKAIEHGDQSSSLPKGQGAGRKPCCQAAHLVLSSLLALAWQEPSLIRAEAFTLSEAKRSSKALAAGDSTGPQQMVLVPSHLLKDMVKEAEHCLQHCQPCSVPDLAWDGSTKAYIATRAPADPCHMECSPSGDAGVGSLLEDWIKLLTAAAASSKVAARELHRCHLLEVFQSVLETCLGAPGSLIEAVESAYGVCAKQSQMMAQDIFDSPSPPSLIGMALHSKQPSLVLVSLDRLTSLVDSCSGADFQRIVQPTGIMAAVHHLMLLSLGSQGSSNGPESSGSPIGGPRTQIVHPWEAALRAAAAARDQASQLKAFNPSVSCQPVADFGLPQAGALKDAAQCLLIACLDRSRRHAGLKPMQAPRNGYWASVRPRELLMMERRLKEEWAAALIPRLPMQSSCTVGVTVDADMCLESGWQPPSRWSKAKSSLVDDAKPGKQQAGPTQAAQDDMTRHATNTSAMSLDTEQPMGPSETAYADITLLPGADVQTACSSANPLLPGAQGQHNITLSCQGTGCDDFDAVHSDGGKSTVDSTCSLRSRRSENLEDTAHKEGHLSLPSDRRRSFSQSCKTEWGGDADRHVMDSPKSLAA